MTSDYRVIGSEESPYSVKVRAYLRYKRLPHTWLSRAQADPLFEQHAKLPLLPVVITPGDEGLQESTLIIQSIEATQPNPSIQPNDPIAGFMSLLLEEFADAWGHKWMVHYRWAREADQMACATRLARLVDPKVAGAALDTAAKTIRQRMLNGAWFVAASAETTSQIENSFKDTLALLDPHLQSRPYLFGGRPALADFGLWGQLYNAHRDPTPRSIMEIHAPNTIEWLKRMQNPLATGEFESWASLAPSLTPLIRDQVAGLFLPWSAANARAMADQAERFAVLLRGKTWEQTPQIHHARTLTALRDGYAALGENPALNEALEEAGCLEWLTA